MRRRCILEVRHVLWRLAVQRVEGHIQGVPRPGQFEAGILRGMRVARDRYLVVQPPAQFTVPAEKVVNQALNDLAKRSLPARYGILERVVPLRPAILLPNPLRRLEQLPARRESRRDFRSQVPRELGNRLFDIDGPAVNRPGPEQFRKAFENVFTNHDGSTPFLRIFGGMRKGGLEPPRREPP